MAASISSLTLALPLVSVGDSSPHLLPVSFLSRFNTGTHLRHVSSLRCQAQNQLSAVVPEEQRWMFDESEANGPVKIDLFFYLFIRVGFWEMWIIW